METVCLTKLSVKRLPPFVKIENVYNDELSSLRKNCNTKHAYDIVGSDCGFLLKALNIMIDSLGYPKIFEQ